MSDTAIYVISTFCVMVPGLVALVQVIQRERARIAELERRVDALQRATALNAELSAKVLDSIDAIEENVARIQAGQEATNDPR